METEWEVVEALQPASQEWEWHWAKWPGSDPWFEWSGEWWQEYDGYFYRFGSWGSMSLAEYSIRQWLRYYQDMMPKAGRQRKSQRRLQKKAHKKKKGCRSPCHASQENNLSEDFLWRDPRDDW
jgi:hypothetical protein